MCFQGLGTWPETGPLGTETWAGGGGAGEIRAGKGTGEGEEAEAKCHGVWSGAVHSGTVHSVFCLQQPWRLRAGDIGSNSTRRLSGRRGCMFSLLMTVVFPSLGHWQSFAFKGL